MTGAKMRNDTEKRPSRGVDSAQQIGEGTARRSRVLHVARITQR